jgi:hypothetical protein
MDIKPFLKNHQQTLVLGVGFVKAPEIKVEEEFNAPINYTPTTTDVQSIGQVNSGFSLNSPSTSKSACHGKIKETSGMIYHLPGNSFYDRVLSLLLVSTPKLRRKSQVLENFDGKVE